MEVAAGKERANFRLQPVVECGDPGARARSGVVRVIAAVGRQPGKIRQRMIGQVRGELAETNKIGGVDVRKILQRVS